VVSSPTLAAKTDLLGVPAAMLLEAGAVSAGAQAMARCGPLEVAVAVTIAGRRRTRTSRSVWYVWWAMRGSPTEVATGISRRPPPCDLTVTTPWRAS
jgi:nicotinamide mononucleotide (NMN) deamidase PncC